MLLVKPQCSLGGVYCRFNEVSWLRKQGFAKTLLSDGKTALLTLH